jgi:sulfite reductase alpha subunit-like flavoprotein
MNEILTFISKSSNLSESKLSIPKMPAPVFSLIRTEDPVEDDYQDFSQIHNNQPYEPLNSPAYKCKMLTAKKLTGANSAKQCWELTLELPEEIRVKYDSSRELHCGDCVAIFSENDSLESELVFERIGNSNFMISADGPRKPSWIGPKTSLKNLIRFGVELRSPVTKAMIGNLAKNCVSQTIQRRLKEFISREGRDTFRELLEKGVTFVDILKAFPELNIEIESLSFLRRLQRRWYSISNYIDYTLPIENSRPVKISFTQVSSPRNRS